MKELEKQETPEVAGGAIASPYPIPGSTPPYVPVMPGPTSADPYIVQNPGTQEQ